MFTLTRSQAYGLTQSYVLVEPRSCGKCGYKGIRMWQYLQLRHLLSAVLGSPRSPPQQSKLLSDIIKLFGLGHEASQYYSKIFCQATTLPKALRTI